MIRRYDAAIRRYDAARRAGIEGSEEENKGKRRKKRKIGKIPFKD
jgi:hypothetical protein